MLEKSVTILPRIGPKRAQILGRLGIYTVGDILFSFPRIYQDFSRVVDPDQAEVGQECLVWGRVVEVSERRLDRGRRLVQAKLAGSLSALSLTWFMVQKGRAQTGLARRLSRAHQLWVFGEVQAGRKMTNPEVFWQEPQHRGLMPVYPLTEGITNQLRISWARSALEFADEVPEVLPKATLKEQMRLAEALRAIHFPKSKKEYEAARQQLVFQEFFVFQIALRFGQTRLRRTYHCGKKNRAEQFLANLPFALTNGQRQALEDVRRDLDSPYRMRRLLEGDVGSGKTIVAEYCLLRAAENGYQAALLVPTEVLARQMFARLQRDLRPFHVSMGLLVGSMSDTQKNQVIAGLGAGELSVVVGTHSLLSEPVAFARLGLAVVDEQHRFGVRQREELARKGDTDLLYMSATPIPRSLALTAFGDLDISVVQDKPPNRRQVDTRLIHPKDRRRVYRFVVDRVKHGEQAFVVFPLLEESSDIGARAAAQQWDYLRRGPLCGLRVGIAHGRMEDKERVMADFAAGKLDVLVATSVVEVGLDVPRATVMVIENAERFGLASLHQLRGRVGRSDRQSYCFLVSDLVGEGARRRLQALRQTDDGFALARLDLAMRGPGDLLGIRQAGLPSFRLGDISADLQLMEKAAASATELLANDPSLSSCPELLRQVSEQKKRQRPRD